MVYDFLMFVLVLSVNRLQAGFLHSLSKYRLLVLVEALVKSCDLLTQRIVIRLHRAFAYICASFVQRGIQALEDGSILAKILRVHVQAILVIIVSFLFHLTLQSLSVRLFLVLFSLFLQGEVHGVLSLPLGGQALCFFVLVE